MELPIPYSSIEDVNIISRWDAGQKFCIRITIPDGSVLLQVSYVPTSVTSLESIEQRGCFLRKQESIEQRGYFLRKQESIEQRGCFLRKHRTERLFP